MFYRFIQFGRINIFRDDLSIWLTFAFVPFRKYDFKRYLNNTIQKLPLSLAIGKKIMRILTFFLLVLCSVVCPADSYHFSSLEKYLSTLKEFSNSDLTKNITDIDGDNQLDVIGLLKNGKKAKIFILVKQSDGSYILSAASKSFVFETNFNGWLNPPEKTGNNIFNITMVIHSGNVSLKECKYTFAKQSSVWVFSTNSEGNHKTKNTLENFNFNVPCDFAEVER